MDFEVFQVNDSVASADECITTDPVASPKDDVEEANVTTSKTQVNDPIAVVDEVETEKDDTLVHSLNVDNQTVEESALDEGWQEAYSKGRSGNGGGRKNRQKQTDSMKQRMSPLDRNLNGRQEVQKTTLRPSLRALKNAEIDLGKNLVKPQLKASGSAVATLASKSVSYKEVALAPPGTVLKPMLEKLEPDLERTETQIYRIPSASNGAESKSDTVMMLDLPNKGTELPSEKQESVESVEKVTSESEGDHHLGSCNGQKASDSGWKKLSATAEPYSPRGFLATNPHCSEATTGNSQSKVAEPIYRAGVSCGTHSPTYYSANHSNGVGIPSTMNPDAPEFVPRKSVQNGSQHVVGNASVSVDSSSCVKAEKNEAALNKQELARQILLSFIVKSAQKDVGPAPRKGRKTKGDLEDTSAKDSSAVTEMVYSREEKSVSKANETNGGEGFVIVAKKRRKNKQRLTNDVAGLYHQPSSVCA
ncbi:unnamed protein product [Arabis nemorensis]|uniref:Uncharacterized protein n=1 Tax=Arabis nemorensis TaxID=586526 RepID=A0A565AQW3_9BRAS|nr:unnamed protein product [Arabis nemorensis]